MDFVKSYLHLCTTSGQIVCRTLQFGMSPNPALYNVFGLHNLCIVFEAQKLLVDLIIHFLSTWKACELKPRKS